MAHTVLAYIVMAFIVMAYVVMAYIVMAQAYEDEAAVHVRLLALSVEDLDRSAQPQLLVP